jgi:hypothetical protein
MTVDVLARSRVSRGARRETLSSETTMRSLSVAFSLLLLATAARADTLGDIARRLEQSVDSRVTGLPACAREGTAMEDCGMGSITRCPACRIELSCGKGSTFQALFMVGVELARKDGNEHGPADMSATLRLPASPLLPNGVNVGLHEDGVTYFRRSSEFEGGSDRLTSFAPVAGPPVAKIAQLCEFVRKKQLGKRAVPQVTP